MYTPRDLSQSFFSSHLATVLILVTSLAMVVVFETGCIGEEDETTDLGVLGQSGLALTSSGRGPAGVSASQVAGASTEVWKVTTRWYKKDAAAGLAWDADSDLDWDQKYGLWIKSLERTGRSDGYGDTFIVTTPQGKTLEVPALECAELLMALRVAFASWHALPFVMEATDRDGARLFAGHFGFRTKSGRYKNTAKYKTRYNDYSHLSDADAMSIWPQDTKLRKRALYGGGDENEWLHADAKAGWYFDELFLNKRVGHFLMMLLPYFGSVHLVDDLNAFHVQPEAVHEGDILLKRWQKRGIGHVMLVKNVEHFGNQMSIEIASGSMPRRQAVWETPTSTKRAYTSDRTGGEGENYDGAEYVNLGGGAKRFMTHAVIGGRWTAWLHSSARPTFIHWNRKDERAGRPARFEQLLSTPSPETLRDDLLAAIEAKREHLRQYPASCSARISREELWSDLYTLLQNEFGMDRKAADLEHRIIDDYVFAELVYDKSRTCCWNSSNTDMYDVIVAFAEGEQKDAKDADSCVSPSVFMMRDGGYDLFEAKADDMNLSGAWNPWSADESCPQQATVTTDTEEVHGWTPWCELEEARDTDPNVPTGDDAYENNDDAASAYTVVSGVYEGAWVTSDDADWFAIVPPTDSTVRFSVTMTGEGGEADLQLLVDDQTIDTASLHSGEEASVDTVFSGVGTVYVAITGSGSYTLTVVVDGGVDLGDPCDDDNETQATAIELGVGTYQGLRICGADDDDWFRIPATTGNFTVRVDIVGDADLDMSLHRSNGEQVDISQSTNNYEELTSAAGVRYLRVYGYNGATADYTLTIQ
jgi:hypothetical protein